MHFQETLFFNFPFPTIYDQYWKKKQTKLASHTEHTKMNTIEGELTPAKLTKIMTLLDKYKKHYNDFVESYPSECKNEFIEGMKNSHSL